MPHRFQFSLRTLFVFITGVAVGLAVGAWGANYVIQKRHEAKVEEFMQKLYQLPAP